MKKTSTIFSLIIAIAMMSVGHANAQGRGRDRGGDREHDRNERDRGDRYADNRSNDRRDNHNWKEHHDHGKHNGHGDRYNDNRDRRVVRHVHVHDHYCHRRPVVTHRHYSRPRYVYYRDYDVYYDYTRNVYFVYTGRSWTMSRGVPVGMRHVNLRNVKRYEVDYYEDDFGNYLDSGRPEYGRECDW